MPGFRPHKRRDEPEVGRPSFDLPEDGIRRLDILPRDSSRLTSLDILEGLQSFLGPPMHLVIERSIANPDLSTILICGAPGSGKTTIKHAVIQRLKSLYPNLLLDDVAFDKERREYLDEIDHPERQISGFSDLTSRERAQFDRRMVARATAPLPPSRPERRVVRVVEVPGVGHETLPRGQSVLKEYGRRSALEKGARLRTVVIHVMADSQMYAVAGQVRDMARMCSDDFELKMRVGALAVYLGPPEPEDRGSRQLVEYFQAMASSRQIESILGEFDDQVNTEYAQWAAASSQKLKLAKLHHQRHPMTIEQLVEQLAGSGVLRGSWEERIQMAKRYIFIEDQAYRWGFTHPESCLVAVNTFIHPQLNTR